MSVSPVTKHLIDARKIIVMAVFDKAIAQSIQEDNENAV